MAGGSEFLRQRFDRYARGISEVQLSQTLRGTSAVFDDPDLVSAGGLVPVLALAESAGLRDLADEHLSVPSDKGANSGLKVSSLIGGWSPVRHSGMGRVFARAYAPSTLGSFLRAFTFGHVRQLDAVASRFLIAVAGLTRPLGVDTDTATGTDQAGFGYSGVRGLNALLATTATATTAPVVVAQRLRKGTAGSPRGAKRLVGVAVRTSRRLLGTAAPVLVRMDSAFYGHGAVHPALAGGRDARGSGWGGPGSGWVTPMLQVTPKWSVSMPKPALQADAASGSTMDHSSGWSYRC